jgi:hypothetical protein
LDDLLWFPDEFPLYRWKEILSIHPADSGCDCLGSIAHSETVPACSNEVSKPHAIDVRLQVDPVLWFLEGRDDVRSQRDVFHGGDVSSECPARWRALQRTAIGDADD